MRRTRSPGLALFASVFATTVNILMWATLVLYHLRTSVAEYGETRS